MIVHIMAQRLPEDQLLLACARLHLSSEQIGYVRHLAEKVDWRLLLERAERHALLPLLHANLSAGCPDAPPIGALAALRSRAEEISRRNRLISVELLRVLALLERHGILALPFQGPALAFQIYQELGLRDAGDLHVWIRSRDFLMARALLLASGYAPHLPPPEAQVTASYPQHHHEYGLMHTGTQMRLGLAWKVMQRPFDFPADVDQWCDELTTVSLGGVAVRALPIERQVLSLCVHGSKHLWERLIWLVDLAELIRRTEQIDWGRLLKLARASGTVRMLLLGLHLANVLLALPLPEIVETQIARCRVVRDLAALSARLMFRQGAYPEAIARTLYLHQFLMLNRFGDKAAVAWRYASSALHPLHVYRKYGLAPLRHLLGLPQTIRSDERR